MLTLTTNATSDTASGIFGGFPVSTSDPTITIGNSANGNKVTLTLASGATKGTATGTVGSLPSGCSGAACGNITITNSSTGNTLTLTTTAAQASASETFTTTGCTNGTNCGPTAGQTFTITNGSNSLIVTAVASGGSTTGCGLATNPKNASFTLSTTANTDATRLNTVINTAGCGSFVGVSSAAPGSGVVNITALNPGTSGNSITLTSSFSNFNPTSPLSGGTDGAPFTGGASSSTIACSNASSPT